VVGSESEEKLQITNEKKEEDLIVTRRNYDNVSGEEIGKQMSQSLFYFNI